MTKIEKIKDFLDQNDYYKNMRTTLSEQYYIYSEDEPVYIYDEDNVVLIYDPYYEELTIAGLTMDEYKQLNDVLYLIEVRGM